MKKDNHLMALLSVWGILLVVLGHSGFEEPLIMEKLGGLHSWIYSFHMPLFFMISGYLFSLTNKSFVEIDAGRFMWKKVLRLLVPYVVLGTVIYFIKFAFAGLSHASRDFTVGNFLYMFVAPGSENSTMGYLWYIVTLFVVFAIVVLLNKMRVDMKKTGWCVAVIVCLLVVRQLMPTVKLFNLSAVVHYMPYFVLGILLKEYEKPVLTFINGGGYYNVLIFFILSIVLTIWPLSLPMGFGGIFRTLVGIALSLSLCSVVLRYEKLSGWLLKWSDKTYSIYILSWFGLYASKVVCINILHLHWAIAVAAMFVFQLIVPLVIDWIVDRCKPLNESKVVRLIIGY